jgi:hypothetical protein
MSKVKTLTSRQQFWVGHLERCAGSQQSLSSYASARGLSIAALYEAKSRLRREGLWPVAKARFMRVQVAKRTSMSSSLFRVSLPNGVVVEGGGSDWSSVLVAAARLS